MPEYLPLLCCYAAIAMGSYVVIDTTFLLTDSAWLRFYVVISLAAVCFACATVGPAVDQMLQKPPLPAPLIPFLPPNWRPV